MNKPVCFMFHTEVHVRLSQNWLLDENGGVLMGEVNADDMKY